MLFVCVVCAICLFGVLLGHFSLRVSCVIDVCNVLFVSEIMLCGMFCLFA